MFNASNENIPMGQPAIAYPFDTLTAAKELESRGFNQDQAEAVVMLIANKMATKDDMQEFRSETQNSFANILANMATKHDIELLRAETTTKLKELEVKLTTRMGGIAILVIGILTAIKFWG